MLENKKYVLQKGVALGCAIVLSGAMLFMPVEALAAPSNHQHHHHQNQAECRIENHYSIEDFYLITLYNQKIKEYEKHLVVQTTKPEDIRSNCVVDYLELNDDGTFSTLFQDFYNRRGEVDRVVSGNYFVSSIDPLSGYIAETLSVYQLLDLYHTINEDSFKENFTEWEKRQLTNKKINTNAIFITGMYNTKSEKDETYIAVNTMPDYSKIRANSVVDYNALQKDGTFKLLLQFVYYRQNEASVVPANSNHQFNGEMTSLATYIDDYINGVNYQMFNHDILYHRFTPKH